MDIISLKKTIYETGNKLKNCYYNKDLIIDAQPGLKIIETSLKLTNDQAILISVIFFINSFIPLVTFNRLVLYLKTRPTKLLKHHDDIITLYNRGLLSTEKTNEYTEVDPEEIKCRIDESLLSSSPIEQSVEFDSVSLFIKNLLTFFNSDSFAKKTWSYIDKILTVNKFIEESKDLPLIKELNQYKLSDYEKNFIFYIAVNQLDTSLPVSLDLYLKLLFNGDVVNQSDFKSKLLCKDSILQREKLLNKIDIVNSLDEAGIIYYTLGDDLIKIFKNNGVKIQLNESKGENKSLRSLFTILNPNEIVKKPLFYEEEKSNHMETLNDLLSVERLLNIQNKLRSKGKKSGVSIILYGPPGTGKTESVYQLAKDTGRTLLHVETSQIKNRFYGDTQKNVKKIFTDYQLQSKSNPITPILFINEADAIFSRRQSIETSSSPHTAFTDNSIQNILLEELENFEGILIATTNFLENFDEAFDRRFLYKIEIPVPSSTVRAKIWRSLFPSLSINESEYLADKFNLSGGQIDNVLKKTLIQELINDNPPNIDELVALCEDEIVRKSFTRNTIGFRNTYN